MDNIYLLMLVALTILAVADIVVGVSNDAINFLNSAIGSKAISLRTIMIVRKCRSCYWGDFFKWDDGSSSKGYF